MRLNAINQVCVLATIVAAPCQAESFWNWTHQASGAGLANVFDGGPIEYASSSTSGPDDPIMSFNAMDVTDFSALEAVASGAGRSHIIEDTSELLRISVDGRAAYSPSSLPGGDNTGGMAESEITSVIEFTMPQDTILWRYGTGIDEEVPFQGELRVLVENVTQSQLLLQLNYDTNPVATTLSGAQGDLIRITTDIAGFGTMGPGSGHKYSAGVGMTFEIPEPSSLLLFALLVPLVRATKHVR